MTQLSCLYPILFFSIFACMETLYNFRKWKIIAPILFLRKYTGLSLSTYSPIWPRRPYILINCWILLCFFPTKARLLANKTRVGKDLNLYKPKERHPLPATIKLQVLLITMHHRFRKKLKRVALRTNAFPKAAARKRAIRQEEELDSNTWRVIYSRGPLTRGPPSERQTKITTLPMYSFGLITILAQEIIKNFNYEKAIRLLV